MSKNYYEDELKRLQHALNDYASLYPDIANELHLNALQQKDPSVERLLEGVAYIASEMKRVADDDYADIYELIIEKNYPEFLQPVPSKTILQFSPIENQLHRSELIKHNFQVSSGEYLFQTEFDCIVHPLRISDVRMVNCTDLQIVLDVTSPVDLNELKLHSLLIYLYSDLKNTHQLYELLVHGVKQVAVYSDQKEISNDIRITPYKAESSKSDFSKNILVRLKDFFTFYEKNFFIEIQGLDRVHFSKHCRAFSLRLSLQDNLGQAFSVDQHCFRLNCVSASNQFQTTAEPINRTDLQDEYPLIVDSSNNHLKLHNIKKVNGFELKTNQKIKYQSLSADHIRHSNNPNYQLIKSYDRQGDHHYYLRLSNLISGEQVISCKVECSNGHEPFEKLSIGSVQYVISSRVFPLTVQNITRPSRYHEMCLSKEQMQFSLSLLFEKKVHLFKSNHLKQIMRLCCWEQENQIMKQIDSIQDIQTCYQKDFHKGCIYDALRVDIKTDESCFSSIGEICIWGDLLKEVFLEYLEINTILKLVITLVPSLKKIIWDPEYGRKSYL